MPAAYDNHRSGADRSRPSLVVGLGASAGGIQALRDFFAKVPPDTPFAYVVILHLSAEHESHLAEVLQATSRVPVSQVRTSVTLAPGQVYVVPPNATMQVSDGSLSLLPMTTAQDRRAPVDFFFRALADTYGARAVAVILSGTGPNGSSGLKRVKERGGLAIAQDPDEADYVDMPANAIASGLVDFVLPVAAMPARLAEYIARLEQQPSPESPAVDQDVDATLGEVLALLRVRTGHDFSNYKAATVRRRVDRRMNVCGVADVPEYLQYLRGHLDEAVSLMKELLISVTNFLRDGEAFRALEQRVIPRLFERKHAADQVRVWSAGCATGEEAYSIAMLLAEHASLLQDPPSIQVFASDLDEQAIATAREGLYDDVDVADVSPERLKRFFLRDSSGYHVRRDLRELVLFSRHNVIKDPPFSHLDLIACRNLLIYLNRSVQERLLETFQFALRPGGYLFLGTSESTEVAAELFIPVDKTAHIYTSGTATSRLTLPAAKRSFVPPALGARPPDLKPAQRISPGELHLRLLESFAPPSLIVTEDFTLVHTSDGAVRYLKMTPGEPSRDLLKIIDPALRFDLHTALRTASQQRTPVVIRAARRDGDGEGERETVNITVKPVLRDGTPPRGYFLVLLEEGAAAAAENASPRQLISPTNVEAPEFEEELAAIRDQLRATIEQYETQSEESRAANEELQAMNEELRSAAEELETSKEELQSVNEELTTVNQELKIKIEELGLTNNDFQNLINSTEVATIFLDRKRRVKLSTPRAQDIFNLLPSDIGRPLSDITSRLTYGHLDGDVEHVLDTLQTIEREVQTREGRWYSMRVVPYRTTDDRIDGVSVTFNDVTQRHQAEQRALDGEERLRALIDSTVDYAIFSMTADGIIDSWNAGAERLFGYTAAEIIGQRFDLLFTADDRAAGIPPQELARAAERGRAEDERWHVRRDGSRFYASGVTSRLGETTPPAFAKISRDLTARQQTALALEQVRVELEDRVRDRTAQLEAEVARRSEAQEQVSRLVGRLVTAQEDERARIARDLHDHLGQQLTALRLTVERNRDAWGAAAGQEEVKRALQLAEGLDSALDFLAWELRPSALDHLGLAAALPRYVDQWSAHCGIAATTHIGQNLAGRLSRDAEIAFYRIAQEALNNVAKHARAGRVDVLFEQRGDSIVLIVEDDGVGFETAAAQNEEGFGLVSMRERAALVGASLQVESTPGRGTSVFLACVVSATPEAPA